MSAVPVKTPIHYQTLSYERQTLTAPSDSELCMIGIYHAVLIRHKALLDGKIKVCLLP